MDMDQHAQQDLVVKRLLSMPMHECIMLLHDLVGYPLWVQDSRIVCNNTIWRDSLAQDHLKCYILWMRVDEIEKVWQHLRVHDKYFHDYINYSI